MLALLTSRHLQIEAKFRSYSIYVLYGSYKWPFKKDGVIKLERNDARMVRCRSSHRCFLKKGVLKNIAKFTGKHLCQSLFLNKAAVLTPARLLKKRLWDRCFPVNFAKCLRTPFSQSNSGRLLL